MSSAYFALKFIKQKRAKTITKSNRNKIVSSYEKVIPSRITQMCRICLKDGEIPICNNSSAPDLLKQIKTFADIEISESDNFPKALCEICYGRLQNAIIFRQCAKESDNLLRQSYKVEAFTNEKIGEVFDDYKPLYNKEQYSCKLCKINFETCEEYSIHNNSKAHRNVRIQCPICNGLFTAQLYDRHLARHQSATHLICEVCGKMYRKDNLVRHLRLHSHKLPFLCKICPYRGRSGDSLKVHMRSHTGDKPYSCEKCHLRFTTRCNLSRHLLTHQKERPYKCPECGKGFYMKRDMDTHFQSDHSGIKEFGCRSCGNKYGTKKALMRHELRVHKREKMAKGRMPLYLQPEYRKANET